MIFDEGLGVAVEPIGAKRNMARAKNKNQSGVVMNSLAIQEGYLM